MSSFYASLLSSLLSDLICLNVSPVLLVPLFPPRFQFPLRCVLIIYSYLLGSAVYVKYAYLYLFLITGATSSSSCRPSLLPRTFLGTNFRVGGPGCPAQFNMRPFLEDLCDYLFGRPAGTRLVMTVVTWWQGRVIGH